MTQEQDKKCTHCGVDTNIQPEKEKGCSHIYYPESCKICSESNNKDRLELTERNCDGCKLFSTMGVHSFTCPIRKEKITISVSSSPYQKIDEEKEHPLDKTAREWIRLFREKVNYDPAEFGCDWGMDELEQSVKNLMRVCYYHGKNSSNEKSLSSQAQEIMEKANNLKGVYHIEVRDGKEMVEKGEIQSILSEYIANI